MQIQSKWCALSKHVQLITQNQKLSVKPPSRLEAIAHHTDEKEIDCDPQRRSCSESGTAATPADGVFGSDRLEWPPSRVNIADIRRKYHAAQREAQDGNRKTACREK